MKTQSWIGLDDLVETNKWKWNDGTALSFLNWNRGEPNNSGGKEHCVEASYSLIDTL